MTSFLERPITTDDLTGVACMALLYAIAELKGTQSPEAAVFKRAYEVFRQKFPRLTNADCSAALQNGFRELLEKGLIDAERDGAHDWKVTAVHLERMGPSIRELISC